MQSLEFKKLSKFEKRRVKKPIKNYRNESRKPSRKYDGKIKMKKLRGVMIFNEGKNNVYFSMNEAAKSLGTYPIQIYVLIARGKGMFLDHQR